MSKKAKIMLISGGVLGLCIVIAILFLLVVIPNLTLKKAQDLLNTRDYDAAYELLEKIGKDELILENKYERAVELVKNKNFDEAINYFTELGDYKDSKDKIIETKYKKANNMLENKEYDNATVIFTELEAYNDSVDKINEAKYMKAKDLCDKQEYKQALKIFIELGDYLDAKEQCAKVEELLKIHATSISLSKDSLVLSINSAEELLATMLPDNTTDTIVKWESSDESIATVDNSGIINGVGYGDCVITVTTSNGLSAECAVSIPRPVEAVSYSEVVTTTSQIAVSESDRAKAVIAYNSLKNSCKFPDTLIIYNIWAYDLNSYTKIEIEFSAENNFGMPLRRFFNATFEGDSLVLTKSTSENPIFDSGFLGTNVRELGAGCIN